MPKCEDRDASYVLALQQGGIRIYFGENAPSLSGVRYYLSRETQLVVAVSDVCLFPNKDIKVY